MINFAQLQENACIKRYQVYLDTGYYDSTEYNRRDMLAWLAQYKTS